MAYTSHLSHIAATVMSKLTDRTVDECLDSLVTRTAESINTLPEKGRDYWTEKAVEEIREIWFGENDDQSPESTVNWTIKL